MSSYTHTMGGERLLPTDKHLSSISGDCTQIYMEHEAVLSNEGYYATQSSILATIHQGIKLSLHNPSQAKSIWICSSQPLCWSRSKGSRSHATPVSRDVRLGVSCLLSTDRWRCCRSVHGCSRTPHLHTSAEQCASGRLRLEREVTMGCVYTRAGHAAVQAAQHLA